MQDQNFDQDQISERIANHQIQVFKISSKITSNRCSLVSSPEKQNQFNRTNIQKVIKDLYDQERKKKKSFSKVKKGWEKGCDRKQVRLMQLRQQKDKKQLENCTFQPNGYKQHLSRRSLGEFLEDQSNFEKKRNIKRMMIKQDLQQQQKHQFRPSIQNYPMDLTQRNQKPIFQRLYDQRVKQGQDKQIRKQNDSRAQSRKKSSKKSLTGSNEFVNRLYGDAVRRQQKSKANDCRNIETDRTINLINQKYVAQKFIKQLYAVLDEMKLDSGELIDYLTFNELLCRLGFIVNMDEVDLKTTPERALVYEAFTYLNQTQLSMKNICVFLLALIGIYYIDPINFNSKQEPDPEATLSLNEAEGRKLQKHFDLLYRNRLFAEDLKSGTNRQLDIKSYTFKPEINPQSELMAENHRNKVIKETTKILNHFQIDVPSNKNLNHSDMLVLNKLGKQKIRQEIRIQQEEKELKECTFKPKTLENQFKPNEKNTSRCLELYNLHKKKAGLNSSNIKVGSEATDPQCTFAPNINNFKNSRKSISANPKNIDKEILRMTKCRKQKQRVNKFLQRGYSKTLSNSKSKLERKNQIDQQKEPSIPSEVNSDQTPFLVVDVSLGNSSDSIIVLRSDIDRAETLADKFAKKHGLDLETKEKLTNLLQQQIRNVLEKIEEESNSSENDM